jgi:glycosyltransferase involved in cell wall biosynthesis/LmbE family N-acetylglucosaminyl deacetylase/SAM-dependent methyltransferase
MHICFPSLSYPLNGEPTSGVGAQVRLVAQALKSAGHDVSVIDLASTASITDDEGVTVHRVRSSGLHWFVGKLPWLGGTLALPIREFEYSLAVAKAIREIHRTRPIDVVEGTETGMLWSALRGHAPLIIRLHGEQYTFHKFTPGMGLTFGVRITRVLQRIALRRAKLLISPSYAHAHEIQKELGDPHPPIVIVPNNISLKGVSRNGVSRSPRTIVYAGRIERRKGIITLLRAAAQTRQALPDTRFVIAGDFHSSFPKSEFESILQACHLEESVDLLGPIGKNQLDDLYKRATLAVLPSHYETFGLAALEPMAFATPVVACSGGALAEVVLPNVNGTLIPAGDETALADAIVELLKDSETRRRMGRAAALHAAKFDVRNVTAVTERLYRWAIGDGSEDAEEHVFFSPHADDVVLSCGGTIESLLNRKKRVQIVTVFAPQEDATHSAFARHIHRKWRIVERVRGQRMLEDAEALRLLGVTNHRQLNYVEAPDRSAVDGAPLYASYDELTGKIAAADEVLIEELFQKAMSSDFHSNSILYFPLSIGQHVDHQILHAVGCRLAAAGKRVRFYEDYPYAENFERDVSEINWLSRVIHVPLKGKLGALGAYHSQLPGLGGSMREATKRVRRFSTRLNGSPVERFWESIVAPNTSGNGTVPAATLPLNRVAESLALRNFKEFTDTFRWHDLNEILPVGAGSCADVGCGNGRHKELVEKRGYKWLGFDRGADAEIKTDALALPLRSESQAAVVAWQVLEYVDNPFKVFAEAARVLETGGVFCGSVSFLEPVHGRTYFNLSPLAVEKLLRENGFADITIKPGLNGFALFLWTWLRRLSIPRLELLAVPLAFVLLAPLAAVLFATSWLLSRLGLGSGHFMRWISRTAPLEFAGHVMFSARKQAHK